MLVIKEYVQNKKIELKNEIEKLGGSKPKLVIVQVNDDPASNAYVRGKIKDLGEIGADFELMKLDLSTTQDELLAVVDKLNKDDTVTGFIVQMPLPNGIDEELIKRSVDPKKDVDGFNPLSIYEPATPHGVVTYLEDMGYNFAGKNALVIGRSNIVGRPMAKLLLDRSMNVTVVHSKTTKEDLRNYVANSDLIVVATGRPHFLTNDFKFKKDAYVIDVGINRVDGHLIGDCDPDLNVKFQSPVPGGVGLLTRLSLLLNLMEVKKNGF